MKFEDKKVTSKKSSVFKKTTFGNKLTFDNSNIGKEELIVSIVSSRAVIDKPCEIDLKDIKLKKLIVKFADIDSLLKDCREEKCNIIINFNNSRIDDFKIDMHAYIDVNTISPDKTDFINIKIEFNYTVSSDVLIRGNVYVNKYFTWKISASNSTFNNLSLMNLNNTYLQLTNGNKIHNLECNSTIFNRLFIKNDSTCSVKYVSLIHAKLIIPNDEHQGSFLIQHVNMVSMSGVKCECSLKIIFCMNVNIRQDYNSNSTKLYGIDNVKIECEVLKGRDFLLDHSGKTAGSKLEINNTSIYSEAFRVYNSEFKEVIIHHTTMQDNARFSINDFTDTKLFQITNTGFFGTIFNGNNFGKITKARFQGDRDSYRYLKHNFDSTGNKIEANAFHAVELEHAIDDPNISRLDKAVLYLNKIVSNFSQNYILPVIWYLIATLFFFSVSSAVILILPTIIIPTFIGLFGVINCVKKNQIAYFMFGILIFSSILLLYFSKDVKMSFIPKFFFPVFAINRVMDDKTTFTVLQLTSLFLCQITQIFIIYQLQIALRKNTRR